MSNDELAGNLEHIHEVFKDSMSCVDSETIHKTVEILRKKRKGKNKHKEGVPIKTIEEMINSDAIYWRGRYVHKGWFMSWQLKYAVNQVKNGLIKSVQTTENKEQLT